MPVIKFRAITIIQADIVITTAQLFGRPAPRIVDQAMIDQMQPGSILVATTTTPAWTPLFVKAAGLILERGGALSHGAIVAREYKIPAVVGAVGFGGIVDIDGGVDRVHIRFDIFDVDGGTNEETSTLAILRGPR